MSRRPHGRSAIVLLTLLASATGCDRAAVAPSFDLVATDTTHGRIAFVSTRDGNSEIYVMNGDGSGVTRLTDDPAVDLDPAWSPDGSRIAFTSSRDGNLELYVMNADGGGVTRLTTDRPGIGGPRGAARASRSRAIATLRRSMTSTP